MSPQLAQPAYQARPGARARVHVVASPAPYRGRAAWPYRNLRLPCRGAPTPYRRHSAARPCALCRAPCPAPCAPASLAPRVSQAQRPYRGRVLRAPAPCHGRVLCEHLAVSWPRSRYKLPSCLALSHNTNSAIQISP